MFNTLKQRAKLSVKSKRKACTAYAFICLILFPVVDFSAYNLCILFRRYSEFITAAEYALLFIFASGLSLGAVMFFLQLSKRQDPDFLTFFDGFDHLFKAAALMFITELFVFLWSLLLIVPGIIASYRYRAALYILAECPDLSPMDALRISKKMMEGKKKRLFLLDLSFIGWTILSVVTLGIAALYFLPYCYAANTEFYREIKAEYIDRQNGIPSPDTDAEGSRDTKNDGQPEYRSEEEKLNHTWEHR